MNLRESTQKALDACGLYISSFLANPMLRVGNKAYVVPPGKSSVTTQVKSQEGKLFTVVEEYDQCDPNSTSKSTLRYYRLKCDITGLYFTLPKDVFTLLFQSQ